MVSDSPWLVRSRVSLVHIQYVRFLAGPSVYYSKCVEQLWIKASELRTVSPAQPVSVMAVLTALQTVKLASIVALVTSWPSVDSA